MSIPVNIAEGRGRSHPQEYAQFLNVAFGSAAELETYLLLARQLGYLADDDKYRPIMAALVEVKRMLSGLRNSIGGREAAARRKQTAGANCS